MKRIILIAGIVVFSSIAVQSQSIRKQNSKKNSNTRISHDKTVSKSSSVNSSNSISLISTNAYPARSNTRKPSATLAISDPIVRTLNARANGQDIKMSKSGIVGMPKSAYGFANGHITLSTTGATTSGTQTGSGLVGTGTSLGTFGSTGPALEVNGKSPYAGINMWGNAMNLNVLRLDSSSRISRHKKQ